MTFRILILGGTTEARQLAETLSGDSRVETTVSLAGRTTRPIVHRGKMRIGGFGGAEGLTGYLLNNKIDAMVDATHPFATHISMNALIAASAAGVKFVVLHRAPWIAEPGDRWTSCGDADSAIAALGENSRRVFVTLGRQELLPLLAAPHHIYLIRSVDPVDPPLDLPHAMYVQQRGPFEAAGEEALLARHKIDVLVTKNSGGSASYAKLIAARNLNIPVHMIDRPPGGDSPTVATVEEVVVAVDHWVASATKRGV